MLTTGKGTHYCVHCGFDVKPREDRPCPACDGDLCEPKKRTPKKAAAVRTPKAIVPTEARAAKELVIMLDALKRDWKQFFYGMGAMRATKKLSDGTIVRFSIKRPPR